MIESRSIPVITDPFDIPDEGFVLRSFSTKLDKLMRSKHISNSELASRTGMTRCVINSYRTGKRLPSGYNLIRLALGIGCTTDALLNMSNLYYFIEHGE